MRSVVDQTHALVLGCGGGKVGGWWRLLPRIHSPCGSSPPGGWCGASRVEWPLGKAGPARHTASQEPCGPAVMGGHISRPQLPVRTAHGRTLAMAIISWAFLYRECLPAVHMGKLRLREPPLVTRIGKAKSGFSSPFLNHQTSPEVIQARLLPPPPLPTSGPP